MTPPKPPAVRKAVMALWAWTAWLCLSGIYQSLTGLPELDAALDQVRDFISIDRHTLIGIIVAGYAAMTLTSAWIIMRIQAGKQWSRRSLMISFLAQVAWTLWPPLPAGLDLVLAVPDLGLQIYALYLLYTAPGRDWFKPA